MKKMTMVYPKNSKPWMVNSEERDQMENYKQIYKSLCGTLCPPKEYIIEKMRKEYSKYGS